MAVRAANYYWIEQENLVSGFIMLGLEQIVACRNFIYFIIFGKTSLEHIKINKSCVRNVLRFPSIMFPGRYSALTEVTEEHIRWLSITVAAPVFSCRSFDGFVGSRILQHLYSEKYKYERRTWKT